MSKTCLCKKERLSFCGDCGQKEFLLTEEQTKTVLDALWFAGTMCNDKNALKMHRKLRKDLKI